MSRSADDKKRADFLKEHEVKKAAAKEAKEGSTTDDKSDKVKEQDENQGRNRSEENRRSQSDSRSVIQAALGKPHDVGGVLRPGGDPESLSVEAGSARARADQATLDKLRASDPSVIRDPDPKLQDAGGAEHVVQFPADGLAHKYSTGFGHVINSDGQYPRASAQMYLDRLELMNDAFGASIKVIGVSHAKGATGIATTMPFIKSSGENPTDSQVARFMSAHGFAQTGYNEVFYNPQSRILASDANPRNFILDPKGQIHPVDLGMQRVCAGGKIERWIKAGDRF